MLVLASFNHGVAKNRTSTFMKKRTTGKKRFTLRLEGRVPAKAKSSEVFPAPGGPKSKVILIKRI
jgi:hypothetical protein